MTLTAANVRVAVTGAVSVGATSATAPTSTSSVLTGFTDLGYIGDGGVTQALPGSGDTTPLHAWQNNAVVRTLRSATEDSPTFNFVLLETKLETIELYTGATVTAAVADGSYSFDNSTVRDHKSFVLDVVDGAELIRVYVPYGIVTEVGDVVYANQEAIGYEVTIEAERDSTKNYNFKSWATALKT